MSRCHGRMRPILVAMLMAVPFAGVGATLTAHAAGAASAPGVPLAVGAIQRGPGGARVSWKLPATNGGSTISGYVVTPYKAGVAQPPRVYHSRMYWEDLTGLTPGASYKFSVAATNGAGTGAQSPKTGAIVIGAPGMPHINHVLHIIRHRLDIFVDTGIYGLVNNGSPIKRLNWTCTSSNGGATASGTGKYKANQEDSIYTTALTAGKTYTCIVTGTNARGTGLPSDPSDPPTKVS